ncbi:MAG: menaquinone reductase, partial [Actinomycetota bacterium]
DAQPANVNLRSLLDTYVAQRRDDWKLRGDIRDYASKPLPMGGAVSNIAGRNWVMIGDAAACINPLNGEGIDYGLETGHLAAQALQEHADLTSVWPWILFAEYGYSFSIARRLGNLLTKPGFLPKAGPIGMRSRWMMEIALRLMGNLVSDEDTDAVARLWRGAGRWSVSQDLRKPFGVR